MNKNAVIIFVRNPVLGKVKTRLAKGIGDERALQVYRLLLQHTLQITQNLVCDKLVFYADEIPDDDAWIGEQFQRFPQPDGDLGERMMAAFKKAFTSGYQKVLIIGSDCYQLTSAIINEAFEKLDEKDVVTGPTFDGGYYLLGMKKLIRPFLQHKKWSTDTVFTDTIKDAERISLTVFTGQKLHDVDEATDLEPSGIKI